jgi:signal transduction histidine kinase
VAAEILAPLARHAVALLAARVPEFEQIAWRRGKRVALQAERAAARALRGAAKGVLRADDRLGHDRGSDVFVVAMLGAPRDARAPSSLDCRAALDRIVAAIADQTGLRVEGGWVMVSRLADEGGLAHEVACALERGARERERYEFFAAVGHELRTPLTSIRGYLESLLGEQLDEGTRRRFVETARREAVRMGRLVDGMLDFSMLDLSADTLNPASCDVYEQITVACDTAAPLAAARGIVIERGACSPARVGLGADGCVQALINIIDNAVKYGRAKGRVRIECMLDPPYACIRVDDDGPGVTLPERERIFDARIRGSAARGAGRGIGLAIVKTIVERAGGEVRAAQSPMGGARFELCLPIRAESLIAMS